MFVIFSILSMLSAGFPVHTLDSLLDSVSRPRGGTASAMVLRLRDHAVLWERDSWRRMLPASTQKALTGSALRGLLGSRTVFSTRIFSTTPIRDSVLGGDLILEGGGDPAFARGSRAGELDSVARELARTGLRRVTGHLVICDPLLKPDDSPWPGSWDWDNSLTDCDGSGSGALSVDGNCPHDSSLAFPHHTAAAAFRSALARAGISVQGPDEYRLGQTAGTGDSLLLEHRSPIFDTLLADALAQSSNHDMEVFGMIAGASDSLSTRMRGLSRVRERLMKFGLDTSRVTLADQCGLSRKNAISARDMANLLAAIIRDSCTNIFPLLPSQDEGTLKGRFRHGLPAGTRLRAKTGSLDGVSNLVALLVPPKGDSLIVVLFFQGHTGSSLPLRWAQDQIIRVLAGGRARAPGRKDITPKPSHTRPLRPRPAFLNP